MIRSVAAQHVCLAVAASVFAGLLHAQSPAFVRHGEGDRQIVKGPALLSPMSARVLDNAERPIAGVGTIMGALTNGDPGPTLQDEFGFRGFNVIQDWVDYLAFGFPPPQYMLTNADGVVRSTFDASNAAPSTYVVGVAVLSGTRNAASVEQKFFTIVRTESSPIGKPAVAVEFYNISVKHYFTTASQAEIDALERGAFVGWKRSVGGLAVYPAAEDAPAGAVPVCRFFSSKFTSHFYTADPAECDTVIAKWADTWQFETRTAFWVMPVDVAAGRCPDGYQPVYRLYGERNGPNHRYVTDLRLRHVMAAAGWISEGFGDLGVVFCTSR